MVAINVERQEILCRNLQRLIDDAIGEVEEAQGQVDDIYARIQELKADLENLDPFDILSRQAIERAIAAQEGRMAVPERDLRAGQEKFRELTNQYEIDQCDLFL